MPDTEFLISLAQNDYAIDEHLLDEGHRVLAIAAKLEELERDED